MSELAAEIRRREDVEKVLREREERMRMAVESAGIGTFDFNPLTGQRQWSDRAKIMFGLSPDADVTDVSFLERVHPEDRERAGRAVQKALDPTGDGRYDIDLRLLLPDGTIRWFIAKGQAYFEGASPNRRATRFIGTVFEITDRKLAEDALRASERRLSAIVNNSRAVIYLKDCQGRYLLINKRYEELFDITQQEVLGKTDAEIFPSDVVARVQANDQLVRETGQPLEFEETVPHADGPHTYISTKFPVYDSNDQSHGVGGISTDITDRIAALEALEAQRDVLHRTIEVQDRDRQLIAYEIHDGLVQYATGALMRLEAIRDCATSAVVGDQVESVAEILRTAIAEGRRLIDGIRTPILDDWGVVAAIEQLIDEEARAHMPIEFVKDEGFGRMAPNVEETLYRVTQEAITNAHKHSQSERVTITLCRSADRVHLEVRDWGIGFIPTSSSKCGIGLMGMMHRAKIAGGQCVIESAIGNGVRVIVDLPYIRRS
jgi:PAS domain S-box-containing protein